MIAELAQRMGVTHTFHNVRGSAVSLLRETVHSADITVFEPLRMLTAAPPYTSRAEPPVAAAHCRRH